MSTAHCPFTPGSRWPAAGKKRKATDGTMVAWSKTRLWSGPFLALESRLCRLHNGHDPLPGGLWEIQGQYQCLTLVTVWFLSPFLPAPSSFFSLDYKYSSPPRRGRWITRPPRPLRTEHSTLLQPAQRKPAQPPDPAACAGACLGRRGSWLGCHRHCQGG